MSNVSLQHRHAAPRHCCHRLSASSTMAQTPPPHIPAACAALAPGRQVPARPGQTASCQVNRGKLLRARPGAAAGSQALYSRGRRCGHALPMPRPAPLTPSQWSGTPPPPRQTAWLPPSLVPAGVGGQGYGGAGDAETGWYLGRGGGGGAAARPALLFTAWDCRWLPWHSSKHSPHSSCPLRRAVRGVWTAGNHHLLGATQGDRQRPAPRVHGQQGGHGRAGVCPATARRAG